MNPEEAPLLHVEDDPDDVIFFRRALARTGLHIPVRVARDGYEAVAYLAGQGDYQDRARHPLPRLIVLDLKLPKKTGLEILGWLRGEPAVKAISVVVLTSSNEVSDMDRAKELGIEAFYVKPAQFPKLVEIAESIGRYWTVLREKSAHSP